MDSARSLSKLYTAIYCTCYFTLFSWCCRLETADREEGLLFESCKVIKIYVRILICKFKSSDFLISFDYIHEMSLDTLYLFGFANDLKLAPHKHGVQRRWGGSKIGPSHRTASCSKFCNFLVQNFSSFQVSSLWVITKSLLLKSTPVCLQGKQASRDSGRSLR